MSYDLVAATLPIPDDDTLALKAVSALLDREEWGAAPAVFETLRERLTVRYPYFDGGEEGVWSSPLGTDFQETVAPMNLRFSRADEVTAFVVELARELRLAVCDLQLGRVYRTDGFAGFTLTLESKPALPGPTVGQLESAVDLLTPNGGPGFLVLESPGEDYVQIAGGDGAYTLEWREYSQGAFRHWVGGLAGRAGRRNVAIPTNGFEVRVKENERLSAEHVKVMLRAFAQGEGRPDEFAWRDVSSRFR